MSRTPRLFSLLLLNVLLVGLVQAQTFYFNDGRKASMPEARVKGANIVVPLTVGGGEGSGEITLPIANLARIDWPAPTALASADNDLKAGKPVDALAKINAIIGDQEIFREVPGSWWNQAAVIKAVALAQTGKDVDADVMIELMRRAKASSADIDRAELSVVNQLVATSKIQEATSRMEKLQGSIADEDNLAALAIIRGRMFEKAGRTEEALLSYLRVPVFSPKSDDQMPAALLGAARAYKKIGDTERAASTLSELTTRFPKSPEAAQATRNPL